ncbi:MAG: hydroxymethylglutaryl-CoA lyase [Bacteroidota bacterium]|nr:hydroxymethylglutaryl-CoA lyase [Bacteroidota bacterium]
MIKITESPRDAMQGLKKIIPTSQKISYINKLLTVGFDTVDVGSFVSSKAVPQMSDTKEVLQALDCSRSKSKISVLVGNSKYAKIAAEIETVDYLNYPFSISNEFLKRNLKSSVEPAYVQVDEIIAISEAAGKKPLITISSAFGNPYGDYWSPDILSEHISRLYEKGLRYFPLADTTAMATPESLEAVFLKLQADFPDAELNLHLHTTSKEMIPKIESAFAAGCRNFDTVFNGMGGCPMSGHDLVANLNTSDFVNWLNSNQIKHHLDADELYGAASKAIDIFG